MDVLDGYDDMVRESGDRLRDAGMPDVHTGAQNAQQVTARDAQQAAPQEAQRVLRDFFGYSTFREGQREIIQAILDGCDCVGVMPTGAGKSVCYQVPALVFAGSRHTGELGGFVPQEALTLVVSPLVSLMHDQVSALASSGIPAAYLNSQLTYAQQTEVLGRAAAGAYALLYVAPERLGDPRFIEFASSANVVFVAVDEAHCVSQWGQDFRPSYLGIANFISSLPTRPIVAAFTATATPRVAGDIARLLRLRDPVRISTGFDRPNLRFSVEQLPDKKKLACVAAYALANSGDSGIVYCSTRKAVEAVCDALCEAGVLATRYHAGLASAERTANQRAFVNDDAPVMVATNAFGMGIDKSNVRYVIHFNMPGSLEAYYQEAGRAGRDGEPSECMLFWNDSDIATARFFIEQESGNEALTHEEQQMVRASQRRRLATMAGYCMTTECLRAFILRYFGESLAGDSEHAGETDAAQLLDRSIGSEGIDATLLANSPMGAEGASAAQAVVESDRKPKTASPGCGNCSNCEGSVDAIDVTLTARAIMRCVHELRGRYGKGVVVDVLRGSANQKIRDFGLTHARTYGITDESAGVLKEIIELLTSGEYLEVSEGRYPLVGLGPHAREAATDEFRLYMKRVRKPSKASSSDRQVAGFHEGDEGSAAKASRVRGAKPAVLETDAQRELFERLRQLRKRLADAEGVPPYIVFSDATLRNLCIDLPQTESEMLAVNGVGEVKLQRYGRTFLDEITGQATG